MNCLRIIIIMTEYTAASSKLGFFELDYSYFFATARLNLIDIVASEGFTLITVPSLSYLRL